MSQYTQRYVGEYVYYTPRYDGEYTYGYPELVGPYGSTTVILPQAEGLPGYRKYFKV